MARLKILAWSILLSLIIGACSSVGPNTVQKDQFNYNEAISSASQQQLLMNLVRLRYSESPAFLRVSSVISQYTRSGNMSAGVGVNTGASAENTASAGGGVRWSDRPVISYTPVAGQEFAKALLRPIEPSALFQMMHAGWPAELVVRSSILSINGLSNHVTRPASRRDADFEFMELPYLWQSLAKAGVLGLHSSLDASGATKMAIEIDVAKAPEMAVNLSRFQFILGLDTDISEVEIIYGNLADKNQIAILTSSIWNIMLRTAWQFNVPGEHIENGRTREAFTSATKGYFQPIALRFAKQRPENAFVSVFAQDYWFYIDKNDRQSKRNFAFLELLLTLTQSDFQDVSPVMTISN